MQECPRTVLRCPCWDPLEIKLSLPGYVKTVLGCPSWDPPDAKSHQLTGKPRIVLGSSGHQVTPTCKDFPGQSWRCPLWDPPDTCQATFEPLNACLLACLCSKTVGRYPSRDAKFYCYKGSGMQQLMISQSNWSLHLLVIGP